MLILCLSVPELEKGQEGMLPRGGFLLFLFKKNAQQEAWFVYKHWREGPLGKQAWYSRSPG